MKLISMTEFVLMQSKTCIEDISDSDWTKRIIDYAKFLSQPLTLGMFVPCDEEGNVLSEPVPFKDGDCEEQNNAVTKIRIDQYKEAKERVLFEGFEFQIDEEWCEVHGTIEKLSQFYEFKLTTSAIKQLGL